MSFMFRDRVDDDLPMMYLGPSSLEHMEPPEIKIDSNCTWIYILLCMINNIKKEGEEKMKIDIFCMTCGTSYKADTSITRCPECERRKNIMKAIDEAINKLDVKEE